MPEASASASFRCSAIASRTADRDQSRGDREQALIRRPASQSVTEQADQGKVRTPPKVPNFHSALWPSRSSPDQGGQSARTSSSWMAWSRSTSVPSSRIASIKRPSEIARVLPEGVFLTSSERTSPVIPNCYENLGQDVDFKGLRSSHE